MKRFVLIFLILNRLIVFSQCNNNLHAKYWMYRDRFEKYFVENNYLFQTPFAYNAGNYHGNFTITENLKTNGEHHIADNTWYEGMYIGVLATEYKLLKINGYDNEANRTLEELKNVLKTINRYDRVAEDIFYNTHNEYSNGQSIILENSSFCDEPYTPLNGFFVRYDNSCYDFESMSQDQVWSLFTGLALAKKLVDDIWVINESKAIAHRIVNAMHHNQPSGNKWEIFLPNNIYDTDYSSYYNPHIFQENMDIRWLRYGHSLSASNISGVFEGKSGFLEFQVAMEMVDNYIHANSFNYNAYGITALSCIGDIGKINENSYDFCKHTSTIASDEFQVGAFSHFSLISIILHGYENDLDENYYRDILEKAPMCGPRNISLGGVDEQWATLNLLACPWQTGSNGYYNGLDYMWLYNLYMLVFHPYDYKQTAYKNIDYNFEFYNNSNANYYYPNYISNTFESAKIIESTSIIKNKEIHYRAGERIILKQGFHATGDNFTAKIDNTIYEDISGYNYKKNCIPLLNTKKYIYKEHDKFVKNSSSIVIGKDIKINNIELYPNPTKGLLHIENYREIQGNIYLYNAYGEKLLETIPKKVINLTSLKDGIYFLKMSYHDSPHFYKIILTR